MMQTMDYRAVEGKRDVARVIKQGGDGSNQKKRIDMMLSSANHLCIF